MNSTTMQLLIILLISLICLQIRSEPQRVKFKNPNKDSSKNASNDYPIEQSKILIAVRIKDHSYSLPTFLATLETLKCPSQKNKCDLWVIFDDCNDNSYDIFTEWLSNTRELFDTILMIDTKKDQQTRDKHPELDDLYFSTNLKFRALKYATDKKFNYIFFINADIVLTNPNTLEVLINKKKTIVAPLLTSSESRYSTYWTKNEKITDEDDQYYFKIYDREQLGCFKVIGVQECFLVDLNDENVVRLLNTGESDDLFQDYSDDMWFSHNANILNILAHVCNRESFGYIPDSTYDSYDDQVESFIHLRVEHLLKGPNKTYNQPLPLTKHISYKKKRTSKIGFDQIYIINLERREDRRKRMEQTLDELNLSYNMTKAVDGKKIDENYLKDLNIRIIPGYKDPYSERSLNYGEIGCFLSHYFIWKDMIEHNYSKIIIFEDDARFQLNFKSNLFYFINTLGSNNVEWELLYLGRKIMRDHVNEEKWLRNIPFKNRRGIINPSYTHWTVSYALTLEGAKKLVNADPLSKILPVDEYLPLMFDKQPNEYWNSFYPQRNVIAYAVHPPIISPTHYTGEPSHISDTENTQVIDNSKFELDMMDKQNVYDENGSDIDDAHKSFAPHIEL